MDQTSKNFIAQLRSLKKEKVQLAGLLQADPEEAFVYFIAPVPNIIKIQKIGGILPRNLVKDFFDVSSHEIQYRREKKIEVCNGESKRMVKLHDCVNLFFNPLNQTYFNFRRNAMIWSHVDDPWSQVVGILEINLSGLLDQNNLYWHVHDRNMAENMNEKFGDPVGYQRMNWSQIYSITTGQKSNDGYNHQFAEWIAYRSSEEHKPVIPLKHINRMIILGDDLVEDPKFLGNDFQLEVTFINHSNTIQVLQDPIYVDRKWLSSLRNLNGFGMPIETIIRSLIRLSKVEQEIGLSLKNSYPNLSFALNGLHGMGHEIRVMFWVLVIAEEVKRSGISISDQEITAALYAAFIHDLRRSRDYPEEKHGQASADAFRAHLKSRLDPILLERCLEAVRVHSLSKDPEDDDILWKILKDADALDRGRFAPPNSDKGCQSRYFRLPVLKGNEKQVSNFQWPAYWLPRVTRFINWSEHPCMDLAQTICRSLNVVAHAADVPANDVKIARAIHTMINAEGFIHD